MFYKKRLLLGWWLGETFSRIAFRAPVGYPSDKVTWGLIWISLFQLYQGLIRTQLLLLGISGMFQLKSRDRKWMEMSGMQPPLLGTCLNFWLLWGAPLPPGLIFMLSRNERFYKTTSCCCMVQKWVHRLSWIERKEMNGSEWTWNYGKGIARKGHEKRMKDMKGSVDIKENKENGRRDITILNLHTLRYKGSRIHGLEVQTYLGLKWSTNHFRPFGAVAV